MCEFVNQLEQHISAVNVLADKIEKNENYMEAVKGYLPSINEMVTIILELVQNPTIQLELDSNFVMQVLGDIIYGIEHEDAVFLLDVFRYGLLEIYCYVLAELSDKE